MMIAQYQKGLTYNCIILALGSLVPNKGNTDIIHLEWENTTEIMNV